MVRITLAFFLAFLIAGDLSAQSGQVPTSDPSEAVFLLVTYDHEPQADGQFHGHGTGTAFFISSDGTALTVSHVAYGAAHSPDKYRLLAVVGKEFYDATVVCASKLPYDPMAQEIRQIALTRDVAEVKLVPTTAFEGRKDELYLLPKNGPKLTWGTAHKDELPVFPFLPIGGGAHYGDHVRVIGFGDISAIPRRWTSEGRVKEEFSGRDGTPLFTIESSNPARPGNSGSPVLNDQNQVVGLWAWYSSNEPTVGIAQRNSAFEKPCQ